MIRIELNFIKALASLVLYNSVLVVLGISQVLADVVVVELNLVLVLEGPLSLPTRQKAATEVDGLIVKR